MRLLLAGRKERRCHPTPLENESDVSNSVHLLEIINVLQRVILYVPQILSRKRIAKLVLLAESEGERCPLTLLGKKSNVSSSVHLFAIYFRHQLCNILQLFM